MDAANGDDAAPSVVNTDTSPPAKNPHRRVKVYMLNTERAWDDKGTGHVSCAYVDRLQGNALIVRSEDDDRSVILESKICPTTTYQKQQETLICWSEDQQELALSFQLIDSCSEIWEKICDVQGRDPGDNGQEDSLQDSRDDDHFEETYTSSLLIDLPAVDLNHLADIQALFNEHTMHGGAVQWRMEKLATSIEAENYIPKLLELFTICDDLENTEALHQLYSIFKTIFMLNKNALFEILFAPENLMKVVGVMEYDPFKKPPTRHRDYLEKQAKFHQVLPLKNETLIEKIHQTFRVQYIQDVILPTPTVFDENLLSALNSFVFFNKCEIVKLIQDDERLMKLLFQQLTDDETDDSVRRDLIRFLKEFCVFSSTLQAPEREAFFQMLGDMHLLEAIETLWNLDDPDIISTASDVFAFIVEANPSMVREFCLSESKKGQVDLLVTKAIEQMQHDADPELGGALLLSVALRILVDPENMLTTSQTGNQSLRMEKSEFLTYFYQHGMPVLTAPLKQFCKDNVIMKDDYSTAQLLNLTVDLLTFCAEHHSFHFRVFMIKQELMSKVLVLLKSQHAFLALCALRFLRKVISLKDPVYNRHIIDGNHLKCIADAFSSNGDKYNLFNSAVIELFEFIRVEAIRPLANHFVDRHYQPFSHVAYVQTFKLLKEQCDSHVESSKYDDDRSKQNLDSFQSLSKQSNRYKRDSSPLVDEEEMWFEREDDDDAETTPAAVNPTVDFEAVDTSPKPFAKYLRRTKSNDDSELPLGSICNPKFQRTISINYKPAISSADSPPASPPPTPPTGANSPSSPVAAPRAPQSSPVSGARAPSPPASGAKLCSLVDYPDEDSDEDAESDEPTIPAKRQRLDAR